MTTRLYKELPRFNFMIYYTKLLFLTITFSIPLVAIAQMPLPTPDLGEDEIIITTKNPLTDNEEPIKSNLDLIEFADYTDSVLIGSFLERNIISEDSLVYLITDRNVKYWDNIMVIVDWTGSMYHYGEQILVWLQHHEYYREDFRHFIFFNDGDSKVWGQKQVGRTGGIYYSKTNKTTEIIQLMANAFDGGDGGDLPENDLEAVLYGLKQCPECEDIILIADAKSQIRDLALIEEIAERCNITKQKIHIVLCDLEQGSAIEYLIVAYMTNGSLHTKLEDVTDLWRLNEKKQKIEIGTEIFQYKKGKLHVSERKE